MKANPESTNHPKPVDRSGTSTGRLQDSVDSLAERLSVLGEEIGTRVDVLARQQDKTDRDVIQLDRNICALVDAVNGLTAQLQGQKPAPAQERLNGKVVPLRGRKGKKL